ncbi:MAG: Serine/threonine-protein kinase StkP [Pseudonocardiales bacterium]|nr:Serine/threonine-protein kinase StkP [Pseudonocardiales bacterium]
MSSRYRLLDRIGRGGMADVYRAEDELLGRQVAVKVFRFGLDAGHERERATLEIQMLASLNHPGLVAVYDAAGTDEEEPYLVLELVRGPSLRERLRNSGRLGCAATAQVGRDIAGALSHIHEAGIVHRDIKPANILLDMTVGPPNQLAAKLTDFGIARRAGTPHLTTYGLTVGTAAYASPEQLRGWDAGPPSDVYSLGLVLIECLTGTPAYPAGGMDHALTRQDTVLTIPNTGGEQWAELLAAMTSANSQERPTAEQTRRLLARLTDPRRSTVILSARTPTVADAPVASTRSPSVAHAPAESSDVRRPLRKKHHAIAVLLCALIVAALVSLSPINRVGGTQGRQPADATAMTAVVNAPIRPVPAAATVIAVRSTPPTVDATPTPVADAPPDRTTTVSTGQSPPSAPRASSARPNKTKPSKTNRPG